MALVLAAAAGLYSPPSFADRRELYVQLEPGLALQYLKDAPTQTSTAIGTGFGGQLSVFYGVTNGLHVGSYGRGFYAPDIAFASVSPALADGSRSTGTLYENAFGFGFGALVRWRFDTGYAFAPLVQVELGMSWARFTNLQLVPTGRDFALQLPPVDVLSSDGRIVVGGEYRIGEHFVISLLVGGRRSLNALAHWQFDAAGALAFVW